MHYGCGLYEKEIRTSSSLTASKKKAQVKEHVELKWVRIYVLVCRIACFNLLLQLLPVTQSRERAYGWRWGWERRRRAGRCEEECPALRPQLEEEGSACRGPLATLEGTVLSLERLHPAQRPHSPLALSFPVPSSLNSTLSLPCSSVFGNSKG